MSESEVSPIAESARLLRELKKAQRRVAQLERVAGTSEEISRQSRSAMLGAHRELQTAVARLRETTRNLSDAKRQAELASEAKTRFLANMSHEIRTPMNGVIGALELLVRSGLDGEQAELAEIMQSSAESLLALINDILDFAKVEAGKVEIEEIPFCLEDCARAVVALETPVARKKGLVLDLDFDARLPRTVLGDSLRLRQVLTNLLSNALKFTLEGSVRLEVRSSSSAQEEEPDDRLVEFRVQDTGIGIKPEALSSIFENFTQEDSGTTRRFGGTGLGLSISKHLVELMGGELQVQSQPGRGTTFTFSCPLPACATPEPETIPHDPLDSSFEHEILVVDDTALNLLIITKMLGKLGCTVHQATGGEEALAMVTAGAFDLVLMDCSMPGMDGFDCTRAIRKLPGPAARTRIVALTAYSMPEDRARSLSAGMDDHLTKPVQLVELLRVLQAVKARRVSA